MFVRQQVTSWFLEDSGGQEVPFMILVACLPQMTKIKCCIYLHFYPDPLQFNDSSFTTYDTYLKKKKNPITFRKCIDF